MILKKPREKGRRLELAVAELLKGYGFDARRTPMSGSIDGWEGDITSPDFPFFTECKNTEKTKFIEWYKKAEGESGAKPPIIVWSKNREDVFCFLLFSDFMQILTGKPIQQIKKPQKPKKQTLEETAGLKYSKLNQLHKNKAK